MAILHVINLYKPGTYTYILVCTIYTIVYWCIPVHTGTYLYVPKPLISYHWSGFQMAPGPSRRPAGAPARGLSVQAVDVTVLARPR
jgi:hypothetical protein